MYVPSCHLFFSDPNSCMPIAEVSKKREEGKKGEGGGWNHTGESGETQEGRQGKTQEREGEEEAQGIVFMIPFPPVHYLLSYSQCPPSPALSQCVSVVQACSHLAYTPESHHSVIHTSVETRWLPRIREGFVNGRVLVEYPRNQEVRFAA